MGATLRLRVARQAMVGGRRVPVEGRRQRVPGQGVGAVAVEAGDLGGRGIR